MVYITNSERETEELGERFAETIPDGSVVEPKDAIKWLLNEKKEKEEAEAHGEND